MPRTLKRCFARTGVLKYAWSSSSAHSITVHVQIREDLLASCQFLLPGVGDRLSANVSLQNGLTTLNCETRAMGSARWLGLTLVISGNVKKLVVPLPSQSPIWLPGLSGTTKLQLNLAGLKGLWAA